MPTKDDLLHKAIAQIDRAAAIISPPIDRSQEMWASAAHSHYQGDVTAILQIATSYLNAFYAMDEDGKTGGGKK